MVKRFDITNRIVITMEHEAWLGFILESVAFPKGSVDRLAKLDAKEGSRLVWPGLRLCRLG
jgi:hypothetical protein